MFTISAITRAAFSLRLMSSPLAHESGWPSRISRAVVFTRLLSYWDRFPHLFRRPHLRLFECPLRSGVDLVLVLPIEGEGRDHRLPVPERADRAQCAGLGSD